MFLILQYFLLSIKRMFASANPAIATHCAKQQVPGLAVRVTARMRLVCVPTQTTIVNKTPSAAQTNVPIASAHPE